MKMYLAYARYNLDCDKDFVPIAVCKESDVALSAVGSRATGDGNKVDLPEVDKYGEFVCDDETTAYGIMTVKYRK